MKKPFILASLPHGRWYHLCECPWALELSKEWLISETVGRIWTSKLWCPHHQLMVGWRCKGCPELISCCGFLQDARMTMFSTFWDGPASCPQVDASSPKSSLLPLLFSSLFRLSSLLFHRSSNLFSNFSLALFTPQGFTCLCFSLSLD